MKNNKGFTLIEMLVVIAVVGILSATVLTALGPARNKAKASRVIAGVNQVRAIAETLYDGAISEYPTASVCVAATCDDDIKKSRDDIAAQGGSLSIQCGDGSGNAGGAVKARQCAFSSTLPGSGNYCVDTIGGTSPGAVQTGGRC